MTYTRTVGEEEYTGTAAMVTVNEPVPPYDPGPYSPPYTPSDNAAPREISVAVSGDKFIAERQPDSTHLLTLPHGTDVTALPVNFALPFGATMTPPNRGGQNFTAGPVTYVVTEEDKMTKETVILTVEFAPEAEPDPEPEPEPTPEPKEEPIPEPEPTPELPSGSGCASGLPALSLIGLLARRRGR